MNQSESFNHDAIKTADEDFLKSLEDFLGSDGGIAACAPVFYRTDGSIDREKTLNLPCYEGFKEKS